MATLKCVSCGTPQNQQLFYEFAFAHGPHLVCVGCSESPTQHVFDGAAATEHYATIEAANSTQSRITASEKRIRDLEEELARTRESYQQDTAAMPTLKHAVTVGNAMQMQALHHTMRQHMKTTMPSAIRSILPPADDTLAAFLMAGVARLGRNSPAHVLSRDLMDVVVKRLLPSVYVDAEIDNLAELRAVFKASSELSDKQRYEMYGELLDQYARQNLTIQQLSHAHCQVFGIATHAMRETFKYGMTSGKFAKHPFRPRIPTDTSQPLQKKLSDTEKINVRPASMRYFHRLGRHFESYEDGLKRLRVTNAHGISRQVAICMLVFERTDADTAEEEMIRQTPRFTKKIHEETASPVLCCRVDYTLSEEAKFDDGEDEFQPTTHSFFIYNLGDEDLILAPGTVKASFGVHHGDLISYCGENPQYQHLFSDTTIPAKGIGNIGSIHFGFGDDSVQKHIVDASNTRILTLEVNS